MNPPDFFDRIIFGLDNGLRTLFAQPVSARQQPVSDQALTSLSPDDKLAAIKLMRVNHAGEVAAQALYQGQALMARTQEARALLLEAAKDEQDHLAWCDSRLQDLGGKQSLLNPLWYAGSFALGVASGVLGDKWNMAFLAETERQVEGHLVKHLDRLPVQDRQSRAVVEQMRADEARHAQTAMNHGPADMPEPVKRVMQLGSKVMTSTSYWV
ncbi:MAG: 2-nonaprenyl-3-methyl-6-methoxy,4-benzoquinol hydroxylase [Pseudomonadota bacterium]|jgi:3-demethoxyubiquinol 3-hydroxylase